MNSRGFWFFILVVLLVVGATDAFAKRLLHEAVHNEAFCLIHEGRSEAPNSDGTRTDCLTLTHAIEADFAEKWYESVGQAGHYAMEHKRLPGIFLIIEYAWQCKHYARAIKSIPRFHVLAYTGRMVRFTIWVEGYEENCRGAEVER